jgi:hypothetical protein
MSKCRLYAAETADGAVTGSEEIKAGEIRDRGMARWLLWGRA